MSEQPPEEPGFQPPGPGQPPQAPHPYQPYGAPGQPYGTPASVPITAPHWAPDHPDATMALILGIIGISVCQVVAPFALVKGLRVKREIDASGGRYAGRQQAQVGYILGLVGTGLLALYALGIVFYIVVVVAAISTGA